MKKKNGLIETNHIKYWYLDNVLHRIDGPAIETKSKFPYRAWYYRGNYVSVYSQEEFEKFLRFKAFI